MANLSKSAQEKRELLNGCEVQSLKHEGCVAISKDKVYRSGELVEVLNSNKKVNYLWKKYLEQEGI